MRLIVLFCSCLILAVSVGGQTACDDPYSMTFVRNNLQIVTTNPGLRISVVVKNLQRLGDGVAVALLKTLDERDLLNTKTVEACLQLIHDSFSYLPIVSLDVNREPKVTMFLLNHLKRNVSDTQTHRDIEETIQYVKHQTAPNPR